MSAQTNSVADLPFVTTVAPDPVRIAIICDFAEENWPSMDLVGEMLFGRLQANDSLASQCIRPSLRYRGSKPGRSARFIGRFVHYPRLLRRLASQFDLFHIVDHSYAHLVHELPPGHAIVTCHDIDAFRCLLEPGREPRSFAFRRMTHRILSGLQSAAPVTCDTAATRDDILRHQLIPAERLSVVQNGVHPELSPFPDPSADDDIARMLGLRSGVRRELLHVGSTIPRKRIDVLLHVFADVRKHCPDLGLLRVGPPLTPHQQSLANALGVADYIDTLERLDTRQLAACYRRASLLLQPSESEGFGLPVVEAMACGTPVVASNIPALREVGGDVVSYCPVADLDSWSRSVRDSLTLDRAACRVRAQQWASQFTWSHYADRMFEIYQQVLAR